MSSQRKRAQKLAKKLRTKWYNEGEKLTRYFMHMLNRSMPDDFKNIENENGDLICSKEGMEKEITDYYKRLYEDYDKTELNCNPDASFFDHISAIPANELNEVTKEISNEELRQTLRTCKDSAPGPDGIRYSNLGHLWAIIGPLILAA